MDQYYRRVEKNEAIKDSLRHKHTELHKDIQIIQTRLISIKKVFDNAMNAESKAEMALYNAFNIQANVKLKIELINSMKAEYNEEYIRFYDKYKEEEDNKVFYSDIRQISLKRSINPLQSTWLKSTLFKNNLMNGKQNW